MKKTLILLLYLGFSFSNVLAANKPQYSDKDINKIINRLTLEQKARLLVGCTGSNTGLSHIVAGAAGYTFAIDSLGIPSINLADGPVGVRITPVPSNWKYIAYDSLGIPTVNQTENPAGTQIPTTPPDKGYTSYCTCFPSTTALAATWNKDMARSEGNAIGDEARAYGVDIILTPGINIMRNPLCGRNFEYFSEDPILTGILGSAMINGIQDKGIGTSLKHFIANNQQTGKLYNDARISQRALREIYLKGFEICIQNSNPWTVMGSYNKIGGKYTQTNPELLRTILRGEWKYDGLVVTDWYKTRDTTGQLNGGTNLMMPGEQSQIDEIIEGVRTGRISEATLNESVKYMLTLVFKSISHKGWKYSGAPDLSGNAELARQIAIEGMVLLKNDGDFLPIPQNAQIALFGATAYKSIAGGTGSSNVNKAYIIDISTGLEKAGYKLNDRIKGLYTKFVEFQNDLLDKHPRSTDWEKISYNRTVIPEMDLSKAESTIEQEARNSDIALIVVGRGSGEESDRRLEGDFYLSPEEKHMIEKVSSQFHSLGKKVAVIMNVCGVMEMNSWKDKPDAILLAWFPGQECGNAITDVVSGKANPSGKLPMTFPVDYFDIPSSKNFPTVGETKSGKNFDYTNYEEDIWVGYRYFNTVDVPIVYPFGYGLSYTDFSFGKPKIGKKKNKWVANIQVTNTGRVSGKEVVQLYISAPQTSISKPSIELKAFGKTKELKPGESEIIELQFTDYDLASFDENNSRWITSKGQYTLFFGSSSKDFKATAPFSVHQDKTWKVNDVLKPVEKVNVMQPLIK
ncbi:beta-glucosidase [Bacteroides sp.]